MKAMPPLALVTGATSGIGFALATQLAERGFDIAISGSSDRVAASADRLRALGVDAWGHQADAATSAGVESFWRFVVALDRPVDVAVLNVGIATGGAFRDIPLEDHLRVVAINVAGTTHMAKRVVDHMVANERGRILVVSSVSATTPTPYEGVYGGTKAFGYNLAETLREELRDHRISVTALLPGATDSAFHANAGMGDSTPIGREPKFPRDEVARLGIAGLLAGADTVYGGDEARAAVERNRRTPEPVKAAAHAARTRPDQITVVPPSATSSIPLT
jgi:uncharacterized protein